MDSEQLEVDIVCRSLHSSNHLAGIDEVLTCMQYELSVISFNYKVKDVHFENGTTIAADTIEYLVFYKPNKVKFLPLGIKEKLPKLKALQVWYGGLEHLDQRDMKPFGSDLLYASFHMTELTALEADLFKFNPNLIQVFFYGNPLKYIVPQLFENFKQMRALNLINLLSCGCVNKFFSKSSGNDIKTFEWNATSCNDASADLNFWNTVIARRETN